MSSLAQDELGHAPALYGLLGRADRRRDADAIAYDREPAEYRHARLLDHGRGDWAMTIARRFLYDTRRRGPSRGARRRARGRRWPSSSGSSSARSATTGCTPGRGSTGWPAADGEPRDRLLAALDRAGARRRDRLHAARPARPALLDAGILDAPMAELERRWRAVDRTGLRGPRSADAAACARSGAWPARPRRPISPGCGASSHRSVAPTRERPGERERDPGRGGSDARRRDDRGAARRDDRRCRRGGRPLGTRRGDGPGAPDAVRGRPRDRPPRRHRAE